MPIPMDTYARLSRYKLHLSTVPEIIPWIDIFRAADAYIISRIITAVIVVGGRSCWPSSRLREKQPRPFPGNDQVFATYGGTCINRRSSVSASLARGLTDFIVYPDVHTHRARPAASTARVRVPFAAPVAPARFRHELRPLRPKKRKRDREKERQREREGEDEIINL